MGDPLDMGRRSVGVPHPHAGFETVTLSRGRDGGGAERLAGNIRLKNGDCVNRTEMRILRSLRSQETNLLDQSIDSITWHRLRDISNLDDFFKIA